MTIPNSVTTIGDYAFVGCTSLTSVHISDIAAWFNINFVGSGSNPLYYAHHLYLNEQEITNLIIPNGVTSIEEAAFYNCGSLTSVTFPNSVTSIGNIAFADCVGLTSVTIPSSVTSIGILGFAGCDNLKEVVSFIEEPFEIESLVSSSPCFSRSTFGNATLYVPIGTIGKYNDTSGWWDFENIIEGIPDAVEDVKAENDLKADESLRDVYRLDGRRMAKVQRGINIVRDKNGATKKVLMR